MPDFFPCQNLCEYVFNPGQNKASTMTFTFLLCFPFAMNIKCIDYIRLFSMLTINQLRMFSMLTKPNPESKFQSRRFVLFVCSIDTFPTQIGIYSKSGPFSRV